MTNKFAALLLLSATSFSAANAADDLPESYKSMTSSRSTGSIADPALERELSQTEKKKQRLESLRLLKSDDKPFKGNSSQMRIKVETLTGEKILGGRKKEFEEMFKKEFPHIDERIQQVEQDLREAEEENGKILDFSETAIKEIVTPTFEAEDQINNQEVLRDANNPFTLLEPKNQDEEEKESGDLQIKANSRDEIQNEIQNQELEKLKIKNILLAAEVEKFNSILEATEEKFRETTRKLEDSENTAKILDEELQKKTSELNKTTSNLDEIGIEYKAIKENIALTEEKLTQEIKQLKADHQSYINNLNETLRLKDSALEKISSDFDDLDKKYKELKQEGEIVKSEFLKKETALSLAENTISELNETVEDLRAVLESAQAEESEAQTELALARNRISELERTIKNLGKTFSTNNSMTKSNI